jgi:hypothetical protein
MREVIQSTLYPDKAAEKRFGDVKKEDLEKYLQRLFLALPLALPTFWVLDHFDDIATFIEMFLKNS